MSIKAHNRKKDIDWIERFFEILEHFSFLIFSIGLFIFVTFLTTNTEIFILHILDLIFIFIISLKIIYGVYKIFLKKKTTIGVYEIVISIVFILILVWLEYIVRVNNSREISPLFEKLSLILRSIIYAIYLIVNRTKISYYLKTVKLNPAQTFSLGFLFLIFAGAWLLSMPYATIKPISFIDSLFTSASAVCVTGLTVVDTANFTLFGQIVILGLIELGGLGIMTLGTFFIIVSGSHMDYHDRTINLQSFGEKDFANLKKLIMAMINATLLIELIGAIIIFFNINQLNLNINDRIFFSIFHSVSAFCNAGFSTLTDSLVPFYGNVTINLTIVLLIIFGGIGYPVMISLAEKFRHNKKLNLHSGIVISMTLFLIVFGTLVFFLDERQNALKSYSTGDQFLISFFHSVSSRTAGFNSIDITHLNVTTYLWLIFLMFIGASPGSTGGGLKTTTFFVLLATLYNIIFRKNSQQTIFKRSFKESFLIEAGMLFFIRFALLFVASIMIIYIDRLDPVKVLFETVSALSTVGLTTGITASLSAYSKIIIVLLMFIGRIGPLTLLSSLALKNRQADNSVEYSEGNIIIG